MRSVLEKIRPIPEVPWFWGFSLASIQIRTALPWPRHCLMMVMRSSMNCAHGSGFLLPCWWRRQYCWLNVLLDPGSIVWFLQTRYPDKMM